MMSRSSSEEAPITAVNSSNAKPSISPVLSLYFDLARCCAALIVLMGHYSPSLLGENWNVFPGHDAVIVFFVLSGYVIAYVSDGRERTLRDYTLSRLSRLWSVAIPATCLSALAYFLIGPTTIIEPAPAPTDGLSLLSNSMANITFLGEGWTSEIFAAFNAPMWSLNYEAWYYAIFAGWTYFSGRMKIIATGTLCVLAGPKIMLLIPCWMLGVFLYRFRNCCHMRSSVAYILFVLSVALYAVAYGTDLTLNSRMLLRQITNGQSYHLGASTSFLGDWLLAPIVAGHFLAIQNMPSVYKLLYPLTKIIRITASYTLSIYLFHIPVFIIFYGYFGIGLTRGRGVIELFILSTASIIFLAHITEHRRMAWRAGLSKLWPDPRSVVISKI
jgi:peptidoglycan/LPS O-acetylase OafA/YrhL